MTTDIHPDGTITRPMTRERLSYLIGRHRPIGPGLCRVCGAEMTIGSMGGGKATTYACGSDEASFIRASGHGQRKAASEHYAASQVSIAYHGDEDIVSALLELRELRQAAGEDMAVPIGELFYPLGHEGGACYSRAIHRGGDTWDRDSDFEFTHDPSHRV